jgi:hypothetical protein
MLNVTSLHIISLIIRSKLSGLLCFQFVTMLFKLVAYIRSKLPGLLCFQFVTMLFKLVAYSHGTISPEMQDWQ